LYPEVVSWGFVHVRTYGLMLAIAFLVGTWLGLREARRLKLDEDHLITVILVTLIASILGARALFVVEHIHDFREDWSSVLAVWQGGLTLYGGVAAGTVAGLWTAKRVGLPMWRVADALAPSLALGTMFGRVGCFLNGCCYGRPTGLPWGVVYPPDTYPGLEFGAQPIHPSQLYFALAGLALFTLVWVLRTRVHPPGTLFWIFILLFGASRVALDFTRAYEPTAVLGWIGPTPFTESQAISIAMMLFATLMILRLRRRVVAAPA
jgi:phosphatidylglycerol:prolipoprotein diacylglycerol transferase